MTPKNPHMRERLKGPPRRDPGAVSPSPPAHLGMKDWGRILPRCSQELSRALGVENPLFAATALPPWGANRAMGGWRGETSPPGAGASLTAGLGQAPSEQGLTSRSRGRYPIWGYPIWGGTGTCRDPAPRVGPSPLFSKPPDVQGGCSEPGDVRSCSTPPASLPAPLGCSSHELMNATGGKKMTPGFHRGGVQSRRRGPGKGVATARRAGQGFRRCRPAAGSGRWGAKRWPRPLPVGLG